MQQKIWSLNRQLLQKKARLSCIPPLRTEGGDWITVRIGKANHLAAGLSSKSALPPEGDLPFFGPPEQIYNISTVIRSRPTHREPTTLDEKKVTGPEGIGAKILHRLAE